MKVISKILFFFILLFFASCEGYKHPTFPKIGVNFWVYPNDVANIDLNYIGGHMYFTGGINGVVVYRLSDYSFTAFDRACPYDWELSDSWIWVEPDGITLKCVKCGSTFNILDGGVIFGPSEFSLKPYRTTYDGMRLRVHG